MHTRAIEEKYCESPEETAGYVFNHTMLRIKNPEVSIAFYCDIMGMQLVKKIPFEAFSFTLYFLGYLPSADAFPKDAQERFGYAFGVSGMLELTHNWGTEIQEGPVYHDGNAQPQGFGHIGFAVPDVNAACDRFERLGVEFIKRPNDGKMKGIAFIKDPDGYWIEIFSAANIADVIGSVSIR